ncbi:MAG TPA: HAMP domain-containing sensor histidine kinase [Acidimicrobiales bacterium]|nr:HAMP domain-containing sensor histidine kinase [Acidimicrobiales bacterium]
MSLRRRLVVGMLVLLIAGVIATDVVTSSSLRSFLFGRVDEQIDVAQNQAYQYIRNAYIRDFGGDQRVPSNVARQWLDELAVPNGSLALCTAPTPARSSGGGTTAAGGDVANRTAHLNGFSLAARLSPDSYVEVIDTGGQVVFRDPSGSCIRPDPAPILPRALAIQLAPVPHAFGGQHGVYVPDRPSFDAPARGSSGLRYRAQAVEVPGGTLVTAISLQPTEETLASLSHVELLVSIIVVIALVLLTLWIVRFGLRPLEDMTRTAGAIAGGDLTRRIRRADDRSEVGRLGTALNGMLGQIEAAFRERTSSEARLRRFVADASHELRTPLTSIRGYAELLRKDALGSDEARRRAAERIEGEASRMGLLVDDLLLLARLDQGRPLELADVDLGLVVGHAVDAVRVHDPSRVFSLTVDDAVLVRGDEPRLRQIADNLLRNAVVHTPAGTPVRVSVARRGEDVVLSVADEGPGLDAEQAPRVFDRFYQGDEARTGEGTGLGLAIVEAIALAHGGRASLETAPGDGATFIVEIPAATSPDTPAVASRADARPAPGIAAPAQGADRGRHDRLAPTVRR